MDRKIKKAFSSVKKVEGKEEKKLLKADHKLDKKMDKMKKKCK